MSYQGAFKNGVVSAFPLRETIDFTGFWGTFQDVVVSTAQDLQCGLISIFVFHGLAIVRSIRYYSQDFVEEHVQS